MPNPTRELVIRNQSEINSKIYQGNYHPRNATEIKAIEEARKEAQLIASPKGIAGFFLKGKQLVECGNLRQSTTEYLDLAIKLYTAAILDYDSDSTISPECQKQIFIERLKAVDTLMSKAIAYANDGKDFLDIYSAQQLFSQQIGNRLDRKFNLIKPDELKEETSIVLTKQNHIGLFDRIKNKFENINLSDEAEIKFDILHGKPEIYIHAKILRNMLHNILIKDNDIPKEVKNEAQYLYEQLNYNINNFDEKFVVTGVEQNELVKHFARECNEAILVTKPQLQSKPGFWNQIKAKINIFLEVMNITIPSKIKLEPEKTAFHPESSEEPKNCKQIYQDYKKAYKELQKDFVENIQKEEEHNAGIELK